MTALLAAPHRPTAPVRVVVRPAPHREPPFDDEVSDAHPLVGRYDQRLPFARVPAPAPWKPATPRPNGLTDPGPWASRLLVGLTETAAGQRPLHQLAAMLSTSVGSGLGAEFERAARAGRRHWLHRAAVRSVRAAEPVDGVAEVCATLEVGRRVRAVALRLEAHRGRWRCTRLQLG